jgi:hypothetical protein
MKVEDSLLGILSVRLILSGVANLRVFRAYHV